MATTDESILEEMLYRITNPSKDGADEMAVDIFCKLIKNNVELIGVAHDMLIQKIYSKKQEEALKAISLLEECMTNCGADFQKRTAKFVFLNKLIQLVIDRHNGTPTTIEVKKRIMDCLLLWTVEYADKKKIREVYDNLKKQVNFEHCTLSSISNGTVIGEKPKSILGKDEDLVSKLLSAGGTENYKKANLLIQHRFSQETERAKRISQHKSKLKETQNTIDLLNEMLDSYSIQPMSDDNLETISWLYNNCEETRHKFSLIHERKCDLDKEIFADTEIVYNKLLECIERYKQLVQRCGNVRTVAVATTPTATTTTQKKNTDTKSSTINDVDILLGDELILPSLNIKKEEKTTTATTILDDDLNDIFGNIPLNSTNQIIDEAPLNKPHINDLLSQLNVLEPTTITNSQTDLISRGNYPKTEDESKEAVETHSFKELKEIDKLSEELLMQSLKHEKRLKSFKKEPEKITLNDLATVKNNIILEPKIEEPSIVQNQFKEVSIVAKISNQRRNENIPIMDPSMGNEKENHNSLISTNAPKLTLNGLSSIKIDLDQVTPLTGQERILINDEHLNVILNIAADRPRPQVYIMILTINNKLSDTTIKNIKFYAGVKKPCKIHVQPPTDTILRPVKSFRPIVPINQVILLWNPTQQSVDINGIIQYQLGDDTEVFSEPIIASDIPC